MSDMSEITTLPRRGSLFFALGLCYAAMMMLAIATNLVPLLLTTLSAELGGERGLTHEQLGRIGAVIFAGLVAGILLMGPLADRLGTKPFAVAGNLLIAGGLAVLGAAPNYDAVLVAAFVMGLGAGMLDMVLSPIVCALQPERRTAAMNLLHAFYCIGAVATILAASLALKVGIAWRSTALGLVVLPVAVAVGFLRMKLPPLVASGQQRTRLRELWRLPFFLAAAAAIFLAGATELGLAQWLPAYSEMSLGYSKWVSGMSLLAFSMAMGLGRLLMGALAHRVAAIPLMQACCAGSAGLFLAACFAPWPPAALAACVLAGLACAALWPSMLGLAADRYPRGGASMFGLLAGVGNFGGIFAPWVVGALADAASIRWGLAALTVCPLAMAMLLVWMKRRSQAA
jgi:fucose permease